jgi:hypothetical protein
MTAEQPLISAVVARLAQPEINLAAWGVVFSLSIIIQSPSAMLLAASTALSRDETSYRKLHRFMLGIGLLLTAIHVRPVLRMTYRIGPAFTAASSGSGATWTGRNSPRLPLVITPSVR